MRRRLRPIKAEKRLGAVNSVTTGLYNLRSEWVSAGTLWPQRRRTVSAIRTVA